MSTQGAGRYSFLLFSFSLWLVQAKLVTISNNQPRTDTMGNVLPIQDCCLSNFDGLYHLYGVKYQCCDVSEQPKCYNPCAFHNSSFAVYTSPDLGHNSWKLGSADMQPLTLTT